MKTIDPEDEATIQRFTTFAHSFSDIKSLNFPDETIEERLVTGFLGSLPDTPAEKPEEPAKKSNASMIPVGWFIGINDKPINGPSRKLGMHIYETYSDANKALNYQFMTPYGENPYRSELSPYPEKKDYEIVPLYRAA